MSFLYFYNLSAKAYALYLRMEYLQILESQTISVSICFLLAIAIEIQYRADTDMPWAPLEDSRRLGDIPGQAGPRGTRLVARRA